MKSVRLGNTGLCVSEMGVCRVGLGAVQANHDAAAKAVQDAFHRSLQNQIALYETDVEHANAGFGQALQRVQRTDVVLVAKVDKDVTMPLHGDVQQSVSDWLEALLRSLGTTYVDVVLMNYPGLDTLRNKAAEQALLNLKALGKVRSIGLAANGKELLFGLANGAFDVVQVDYARGDTSAMKLAMPLARHLGTGVLVSAPLPQSLPDEGSRTQSVQLALASDLVHSVWVANDDLEASIKLTTVPSPPTAVVDAWIQEGGGVDTRHRCKWADDPLLTYYHDCEWGRLPEDDGRWFEFLVLETFQAGLSWKTILNKRKAFRAAFRGFDVCRVAEFTSEDVERLMGDAGIVRNRKKIEAAVENAKIAQQLIGEYGTLKRYFVDVVRTAPDPLETIRKQFRFVGKTTAESIAFATGIVEPPHTADCWMSSEHNQ